MHHAVTGAVRSQCTTGARAPIAPVDLHCVGPPPLFERVFARGMAHLWNATPTPSPILFKCATPFPVV
jgi:hypothetical protein